MKKKNTQLKNVMGLMLLGFSVLTGMQTGYAQTYTFTNATAIGANGPTQVNTDAAYTATTLDGDVTITTQGIQEWTVPATGNYSIQNFGAEGGTGFYDHGQGATMYGEFALTAGQVIYIVVGQKGIDDASGFGGGGGGGGTYVWTTGPTAMIIAGGGAGGSDNVGTSTIDAHIDGQSTETIVYNAVAGSGGPEGQSTSWQGGGGAGWNANGIPLTSSYGEGGLSPANGSIGGASYSVTYAEGGFGGGGGSGYDAGGGGGGYTGGNGGAYSSVLPHAGGAGSYNSGTNQTNSTGTNVGHGQVIITLLCIPTSIALDNATLTDLTDECSVSPVAPTATNDCSTVITGTTTTTFPITTQGPTVVTWNFDDGQGNTTTQDQNVMITDITAPVADVATLSDVTGVCEITSLTDPTATDNCAGTVTVTNDATLPISADVTITWTYDDGNGNTSTQTQDVVITDAVAPVADLATLADITAECEVTSLTDPTATDNCAGTVIVTNDATLPITAQATTVVTWTYDDGNGNTSTQTQNVILTDITAPVGDNATLADVTAECEVTSLTDPTATDNCAGTVTVTNDATLPITADATVTWTYDDGNGNTSTQTQDVVITAVDITTSLTGFTITANNTSATAYQWIDCSDNSPISGETGVSFTATTNGDYAVIVTNGSCSETSSCVTISGVGIEESNALNVSVYPNPNNGEFYISTTATDVVVSVYSIDGKVILSNLNVVDSNQQINLGNVEAGVYFVKVTNATSEKTIRLVVE